jgi:hypothetical protein
MEKDMELTVPDEIVISKIYYIRGQKIMVDRDLAELYGVETKALKQAVNRNSDRFPNDFMFEMTKEELENWRSQNVTSNSSDKMGLRYAPYCFTEHGVLMLSSVLKSKKAIQANIAIMRVFVRIRQMLIDNTELRMAIEEIRRQTNTNTKSIEALFQYVEELMEKKAEPRQQIGYEISK